MGHARASSALGGRDGEGGGGVMDALDEERATLHARVVDGVVGEGAAAGAGGGGQPDQEQQQGVECRWLL